MPDPNHWQPIDTAPKNGTIVIVWPPTSSGVTSCASCASWDDGSDTSRPRHYWRRVDALTAAESLLNPPTHWRPVLAGPGATND